MTPIRQFFLDMCVRHDLPALQDLDGTYSRAGYVPVRNTLRGVWPWHWEQARQHRYQWCDHHVGQDNYTWVGDDIWFTDEKLALAFCLRWS